MERFAIGWIFPKFWEIWLEKKKTLQKFTLCFCFPFTGGASWIVIFRDCFKKHVNRQQKFHVKKQVQKLNSSPLKTYLPKNGSWFANHHFSGVMFNLGVYPIGSMYGVFTYLPPELPNFEEMEFGVPHLGLVDRVHRFPYFVCLNNSYPKQLRNSFPKHPIMPPEVKGILC